MLIILYLRGLSKVVDMKWVWLSFLILILTERMHLSQFWINGRLVKCSKNALKLFRLASPKQRILKFLHQSHKSKISPAIWKMPASSIHVLAQDHQRRIFQPARLARRKNSTFRIPGSLLRTKNSQVRNNRFIRQIGEAHAQQVFNFGRDIY